MEISHIFQPEGSNLCGQACVAMLAGVSLEEATQTVGKSGLTLTRDVRQALEKYGFVLGPTIRVSKKATMKDLCLCTIHYTDSENTHWTIYNEGVYYDPAYGVLVSYPPFVRITSFIQIYQQNNCKEVEKSA